jgi:hypothetical protein
MKIRSFQQCLVLGAFIAASIIPAAAFAGGSCGGQDKAAALLALAQSQAAKNVAKDEQNGAPPAQMVLDFTAYTAASSALASALGALAICEANN